MGLNKYIWEKITKATVIVTTWTFCWVQLVDLKRRCDFMESALRKHRSRGV